MPKSSTTLTVRLPATVAAAVKAQAARHGISLSAWAAWSLERQLHRGVDTDLTDRLAAVERSLAVGQQEHKTDLRKVVDWVEKLAAEAKK